MSLTGSVEWWLELTRLVEIRKRFFFVAISNIGQVLNCVTAQMSECLTVDSEEYMRTRSVKISAVIEAWLNASQRSRESV